MQELARRIILFRAKYGLTQEEFAELCNVSRITIHGIEAGRENISKVTRAKIELALGGNAVETKYKQN